MLSVSWKQEMVKKSKLVIPKCTHKCTTNFHIHKFSYSGRKTKCGEYYLKLSTVQKLLNQPMTSTGSAIQISVFYVYFSGLKKYQKGTRRYQKR